MNSKACILVVDDNRSLVRVIERILEKEGFDVLTAFDGPEGLQKAREEKPDLIVLDIVMPEMDGYEVCRHLQRDPNTARIPVLMLTRLDLKHFTTRDQKRIEGFEAGAIDYLSKPVTAKGLLDRVRDLLRLSRLGQVRRSASRAMVGPEPNRARRCLPHAM